MAVFAQQALDLALIPITIKKKSEVLIFASEWVNIKNNIKSKVWHKCWVIPYKRCFTVESFCPFRAWLELSKINHSGVVEWFISPWKFFLSLFSLVHINFTNEGFHCESTFPCMLIMYLRSSHLPFWLFPLLPPTSLVLPFFTLMLLPPPDSAEGKEPVILVFVRLAYVS